MISIKLFILFLISCTISVNSYGLFGQNYNSCVETCGDSFEVVYSIDLSNGQSKNHDEQLVELLEDNIQLEKRDLEKEAVTNDCSKNVLLRIPFNKLLDGTILKLELDYGDLDINGTTFHIGNSPTNYLNGGDRNTTLYDSEIYSDDAGLKYYMGKLNLCDQDFLSVDNSTISNEEINLSKVLLLNETTEFLNRNSKLVVYVSDKWFRIDSVERNTSFYYNNKYLFTFNNKQNLENKNCANSPLNKASPYLYIGLNRVIGSARMKPGSGLCSANISFINCHLNDKEPDALIDVKNMIYKMNDNETISWVHPLGYLDDTAEHSTCSGEGVLKLKFDSLKRKRVARFDLEFGEIISGFTFNIGDSPTNNGYGGDAGTTSNSAEIHSNENRFYVWLNTKYCGDTLLYKMEYNFLQSHDNLTLFISDQRIEISSSRGYFEILRNPYLFNLNGQSVTCNCFDTRCYAGVKSDDEIYFGINRVVGGTYRPGIGLCKAKISWLQCRSKIKRDDVDFDYNNHDHESTMTTTTTTTTTQSLIEPESNSTTDVAAGDYTTTATTTTITTNISQQDNNSTVDLDDLNKSYIHSDKRLSSLIQILANTSNSIQRQRIDDNTMHYNLTITSINGQRNDNHNHESKNVPLVLNANLNLAESNQHQGNFSYLAAQSPNTSGRIIDKSFSKLLKKKKYVLNV